MPWLGGSHQVRMTDLQGCVYLATLCAREFGAVTLIV